MKPRKTVYLVHRWLALIISLQLLAWSTGGFLFSILTLDLVRGERDMGATRYEPLTESSLNLLPDSLQKPLNDLIDSGADVAAVTFQDRGHGVYWEIRDSEGELITVLEPVLGRAASMLTSEQAVLLAQRDFAHVSDIENVRLIERDPPSQYRSGALPAYEVVLDHSRNPHIYIDARTGAVTARRNTQWRIFDFFWMLHTMDYTGRDDFNHPLLTISSILAILTSFSGLTLWGWRARARIKKHTASKSKLPRGKAV